jgi:hypothetical protein
MAQHANYWSCSKFADWLRGTAKPPSETWEGWDDWHDAATKSHSLRYWLAEEGLGKLQDVVTWPKRKIDDVRCYISNRYVSKTHALTSNLKKGAYHEYEERLLHSMFDSLVDYVEIEEAWNHLVWANEETRKMYRSMRRWTFTKWRDASAGIDHLLWAAALVQDESTGVQPSDAHYGSPTGQARHAIEILELYNWWKSRVSRPDPYEVCGWIDYCARRGSPENKGKRILTRSKSNEDQKESSRILKAVTKMEEAYDKEDTDMMIRLIKARKGMWT